MITARRFALALFLFLFGLIALHEVKKGFPFQKPEAAAETARWAIANGYWGYVTMLDGGKLDTEVMSYSDGAENATGRPFFYVMCAEGSSCPDEFDAALTLSQASLNLSASGDSCAAQKTDPEDPRCGKFTFSGQMRKATGETLALGKQALFARHPQMAHWPASHGFTVYELVIADIWMIDFYGGGAGVTPEMYYAAEPRHNVPAWPPHSHAQREAPRGEAPKVAELAAFPGPPKTPHAQRARWLVYHSTWTVVGTTSVRLHGKPWGNVRSVADMVKPNCTAPDTHCCTTGMPIVYVPTPDPTHIDLQADNRATISFSEAALRERAQGPTCHGMDSEDPTCARLVLSGRMRPLNGTEVELAKVSLAARHPLAPWLAAGGAHTGGNYYTMEVDSLTFFDYYGGPAEMTLQQYLASAPEERLEVVA